MRQESTSAAARILQLDQLQLLGRGTAGFGDHPAWRSAANSSLRGRAADPWQVGDLDASLRGSPGNGFLEQVRLECRRAERSHSPLSLICYRPAELPTKAPEQTDALLEALYGSKRETDLVGCIGVGTVAVLCPDTTREGCEKLKDKISLKTGRVDFVAESATFPNDLFDSLEDRNDMLQANDLFGACSPTQSEDVYWLKRPLDIVLSLLGLLVFSPIMLVVAAVIAIDRKGPILFKQQRLGRHGKQFSFFKFRSMRCDNDDSAHREFVLALIKSGDKPVECESGTSRHYKLQSNPRVTRFGKFIRRTSIDELPQLFNVLRGDMSLVGPRPPIPYEVQQYRPWHLRRVLTIKPGMTGLWQVEGRSRVGFDEMVRMDLRYIRGCSLALDVKLMLRTVPVVLRCDGAV